MAQRAITSFFSPPAKKPRTENKSLLEKIPNESDLNQTKPVGTTPLSSFARGSQAESVLTEAKQSRHNAFLAFCKGSNKQSLPSERRQMKPYDLQYIELKKKNLDSILMIQNGYKYQILGSDAYTAAQILGRSPVHGWRSLEDEGEIKDRLYDRFASLTFPLERLPYYVEKLVRQGLKIAVAKQLETSALKAQGSNKKGPFKREVTNVYTKGTMVEELTGTSMVNGHVLALNRDGDNYGLVAIQTATGDGVKDVFKDSSLAIELETRLLHIQPSEILLVGDPLDPVALKIINSLDARVIKPINTTEEAESGDDSTTNDGEGVDMDLQGPAIPAFKALKQYLNEFSLLKALELEIKPFSLKTFMYLNGDTLNSLEIFQNQTDSSVFGSLLWLMDATKTAFGRRLLRSWIGKPLLSRELLAERVEAMEELMAGNCLQSFQKQLEKTPDLERYLIQIFHSRIQPKQLYWCLYFFDQILSTGRSSVNSPLLHQLLKTLQPCKPIISKLLSRINPACARNPKLNLYDYFRTAESSSQNEDISDLENLELSIFDCRSEFDRFLSEESKRLAIPLKLANVFGEEDTFVISVPKKFVSKVPTDWRRQGSITMETRFWAPFSLQQSKILKPLLEKRDLAARSAYDNFVQEIANSDSFQTLRTGVSSIATFDALFSLANVSSRLGYTKPEIVDGVCLEIINGRHPMLEALHENNSADSASQFQTQYIPNSVCMYSSNNRAMIITGANMGGKSSLVKQVALITIMAQSGCYVPAEKCRMSIRDAIYTRMGAFDNLLRGESTFMVELKECANIMQSATENSLVLLDEIGRGTSTMDGVAIAEAVLRYMVEDVKSFTLFVTHYPSLCDLEYTYKNVLQNWSMDVAETDDEVLFLYKLVKKRASGSYGLNVARLAELPENVLIEAKNRAFELEKEVESRKEASKLKNALEMGLTGDISALDYYLHEPEIDNSDDCIAETQQ